MRSCGNVDLGVVSVAMKVNTKVAIVEDITEGEDVYDEEKGTKNRTLRDTV